MPPRLLAFDLDGTLLTSDKRLSRANASALADMAQCGAVVVLASGRIGSSMMQLCRRTLLRPRAAHPQRSGGIYRSGTGLPACVFGPART